MSGIPERDHVRLFQRTLARAVRLEGIGLHGGSRAVAVLCPAPPSSGVTFVRTDLPGKPEVKAEASAVVCTLLATTLGRDGVTVATVEHLLAATVGMGVDNLRVELDGPEVPVLDGSARPFALAMAEAGLRDQAEPLEVLVMRHAVTVSDGDKVATLAPARRLKVDCSIAFDHPLINAQRLTVEITPRTFLREIAGARTFGFLHEVESLRRAGLARGGSLDSAVVVDAYSVLNPGGLRFPDEFVRHKLLDALGDLALIGRPVVGALTLHKGGHALHQRLVQSVLADPSSHVIHHPPGARDEPEPVDGVLTPTLA